MPLKPSYPRHYEKRPKKNLKLRSYVALMGINYGDIAEELKISKSTLSQWMSYELSKEKELMIIAAVKKLGGHHESQRVSD